ncbi:major facilitator superfamily transporter [Calocera viscosa TUFC12733]|uniref:Major facilitator superfamily transporter n=1 Tax=Calocera viscosa (strain TUFC12733) TaxID=1330018 RepID=A0A167Q7M6_CALVF|nr:major facilitator superfamily transporter [Calocera viscosa TUFC12733]
MSSTPSEKDIPVHTEDAHQRVPNEKALHYEVILEDVQVEQLVNEVQAVDQARADELHAELAASSQQGYHPITPEERIAHNRLNRKFDLMVVPFCALIYLFNGLDRSNVGNAVTNGFITDLNLPANAVNTATTLFFATYVPCMPISASIGKKVGQSYWLGIISLCWGILTLGHAFVKTQGQLIAIRLLIGVAESGFFATATSFIALYYPRHNLALRLAFFYFAFAIAGGFGGLIAYGCFTINGALWGWQYLFIIEGIISIVIACIAPFWLPKSPGRAWFLTPEERHYADKRMVLDAATNIESTGRLSRRDIIEAFKDWKMWIMLPSNIFATLGPAGFSIFFPVVVKGLGYTGAIANLMTVPPYVIGAITVLCMSYSSDYFRERTIHTLVGVTIVIIGLGLAIGIPLENTGGRYGGLVILLMGTFVSTPITTAWIAGNTPEPGKRTVVLAINGWGNLGGIIGSEIYVPQYGPDYRWPLTVSLIMLCCCWIGYVGVHLYLRLINSRRAKLVAKMTPEELERENKDDKRYADKKLTFVYGL